MKKLVPLFSVLALIILCAYSGCSVLSPTPKETLPPATQTGANTFGFLLNGQVWLPKGYNGTSNLDLSYDPAFMGGTFNLSAYRYYGNSSKDEQYVTIYLDSLSKEGTYNLYESPNKGTYFSDHNKCTYFSDTTVNYKKGNIIITKLDLQKGIVSGTFQFTLFKSGCDSIKITQGRFDKKI
jgi:hypothetical protein